MGRNTMMECDLFVNKSQYEKAFNAIMTLNFSNNHRHLREDYSKCTTFPELIRAMEFSIGEYTDGLSIHGYEGSTSAMDDVHPVIEALVPFLDFDYSSRQSIEWKEEMYEDECDEYDDDVSDYENYGTLAEYTYTKSGIE